LKLFPIYKTPPKPADFRCKSAPQYPYNAPPDSPELSVPKYGITARKDVYVPVSDGHRVAVDIYRPNQAGRYPALLAMSSYTKELQGTDSPSLCNEAGDIEFFVSRGYGHVIADSRGSGHTGGEFALFGNREIRDSVELVEWIAGQPWCNGNVGMIGMSYFAVVQLLTAKKNPPHLKCIFAYDPIYDLYRDGCYHGGVMSLFNWLMAYFWIADHLVFSRDSSGEKNKMNWHSFLSLAWRFVLQKHRFDDSWMRERSGYWQEGSMKIPVYVGSGWEYAVGLHLRGIFDAFRDVEGPKKMLIGPPQVPFRPYSSWRLESLRWYDRWLKGMDTGIDRDPPVNIWIMGRNKWRSEQEWPIERTRYVDLYLRPTGKSGKIGHLSQDQPNREERSLSYLSWPLSPGHFGRSQLIYRSPALSSEVEITGHIVLTLYASCSARDTNFHIKLCDENEDGSFRVLSKGWLKASHRTIDRERSLPYRPFHPHAKKERLKRGKIYEYLIEIWPTANLFIVGHRIRLEIACTESLYYDFPYVHFSAPSIGRIKIFSSPQYPSKLTVPVIDSTLNLGNRAANVLFADKPSGYFATRGKDRQYGSANEFIVK
jgi:predicted acyl esterase